MATARNLVMNSAEVISEWIADTDVRRGLQQAISSGIASAEQIFQHEYSFRVPRARELRENQFQKWLESYRERLEASIADEVHKTFPFMSIEAAKDAASMAMNKSLPELKARTEGVLEVLRQRAIQAIALNWTSRNISDGIAIGTPSRDKAMWRVPLFSKISRLEIGQIMLDRDGEVVDDIIATRDKVLTHV